MADPPGEATAHVSVGWADPQGQTMLTSSEQMLKRAAIPRMFEKRKTPKVEGRSQKSMQKGKPLSKYDAKLI